MQRLAIQIDYTDAQPGYFDWLNERLSQFLAPLDLEALVFIAHNRIPRPVPGFSDGSLYNFTEPIIRTSEIRRRAQQQNDWYVHVLITNHHDSNHLGLMYDVGFDRQQRQGCAVFADEVLRLTGNNYTNFSRVILRVILHELGHCLNFAHRSDFLLMAQTGDIQRRFGTRWIERISYEYSPVYVDFIRNNPNTCEPGTDQSFIGITADTLAVKRSNLSVSASLFTDNSSKAFEIGDAVSLMIKLHNRGKQSISMVSPLDPNIENYKILLQAPGKKKKQVINPVKGCGIPTAKLIIKSGQHLHFPLNLFGDKNGYLFEKSGTYKINVEILSETNTWIKSRPISFKIKKPATNSYLTDILNSPGFLKYMLLGDYINKTIEKKIRKTIGKNPGSGFSRTVHWNMYYHLKKKLKTTSNSKTTHKLTKEFLEVTQNIISAETSKVRKGKILLEQQKAASFLKQENMTIDTIQKKNIKEYNKYKNKAIIKPVINSRLPQQALWCLLFMIMLVSQYSCKKVDYVDSNVIYGSLSYNNIVKGLQSLPSGQKVDVFFNDSLSTINSFTTTEIGKYNFIPTVKGNYNFEFKFTDTLLQYNNALVEKPDIDTLRPSSSYPVVYQFKTNPAISVDKKDNSFQQNVTLQIKETGIRLQMVDENEHPISNAKVCIYANQQFAAANAPYCGGCLAYLSSDINGNVFFVGLQAQSYYLNARARIGVVSLSNQYADEMKTTGAIQAGVISSKKIILK